MLDRLNSERNLTKRLDIQMIQTASLCRFLNFDGYLSISIEVLKNAAYFALRGVSAIFFIFLHLLAGVGLLRAGVAIAGHRLPELLRHQRLLPKSNLYSKCNVTVVVAFSLDRGGVVAAGGDDGIIRFLDWRSGHCFQQEMAIAHPGSLESEACICAVSFDVTGSRLVTCGADKTIKMWGEL
uniref:Uncharacterized protein n=1 Tax=Oryza meridionalis TaxID=40149 RepID=A0A0E0ETV8_9ORYZ